jgi:putative oxidoreductase
MSLGLLIIRIVVGLLFVGHGTQKLFGWFGGNGREATASFYENNLGLSPGWLMTLAAGGSEAGGGILIALGLLTPLGAAAITAVMVTAIATVHFKNGIWVTDGGYEYNLVMIAAVFAITAIGPGSASLDNALSIDLNGNGWAIAEIVVGAIGALATVALGHAWANRGHPHPGRA